MSASGKRLYQRRKRARLCVWCAAPRERFVLCEACRVKANAKLASRYLGSRAVGACTWSCCSLPTGGSAYCTLHRFRRARAPSRTPEVRRASAR